jgi:spore maturation protein CgeB
LRKPKLELEDEAKIYSSSIISINVHEDYQRQYGGDCNERTFKIPMCNGFQVVDNVACIKKYFDADSEVIVADSDDDWIEKTHYYLNNADKRNDIIKAGRKKALSHHTYHHRAQQILDIAMKKGT